MRRSLYLASFAYIGLCAYALVAARPAPAPAAAPRPVQPADATGSGWFAHIRQMCNPVEVDVAMRGNPPPGDFQGHAYAAACYALAGRIDQAREAIRALPAGERHSAAGVLLGIADNVADAGDDRAAAPIMRLVLEFNPDSFIALYHAGMSEYALGDRAAAAAHLRRFMQVYSAEDGWRERAREVLAELGGREGA
jgi:tetratricopeptide (TPR) repeat protein